MEKTRAVSVVRAAIAAALGASLVVYAAVVGHNFFRYVDRAIYVAVDDGEAGIAYLLATQARYGFLASPTIEGMSRLHGQFNYGPWYFHLAAGIVWLFGYSLTAIRSIHLWVVIGSAAAAGAWFRHRDRAAVPALFGFGILYFFETVEWPMARPDSLVTAFAIGMVVSTGLAVTKKRPACWFLAGLAAACGAFTHLIAASLVVSCVALFGACAAFDFVPRLRSSAVALAAGLAAGAAMFYASFGFDVARQYRFLRGYRDVTASTDTYLQTLAHHYAMAFSSVPAWLQVLVGVTFVMAWTLTLVVMRRAGGGRQLVTAYLLPPTLVWTFYFLSIGKYTNYHSGYAILQHAMFLWTAAALLWVMLSLIAARRPRLAIVAGTIASVAVLGQGVRLVAGPSAGAARLEQSAQLVPFSDYADRVLGSMPGRATAWGSVIFGIESPDRIQLVQHVDAAALMRNVPVAEREALAPDYLVWGYAESHQNLLAVLGGRDLAWAWSKIPELLPDTRFRLVSLTSGAPYGVTRVYAKSTGPIDSARGLPEVAAYDAAHGRWLTRVGAVLPVAFARAPSATVQIRPDTPSPARIADATVTADLPAGVYLLHVSLTPGAGPATRRLIAVVSPSTARQPTVGPAPVGDFAPYLAGDRDVFALATHPGGALQVSQEDDAAGAGIGPVTVYPVHGLLDPVEEVSRSRPLPAFDTWTASVGVRVTADGGRLRVDGDATALGYQVVSPVISSGPGDQIDMRVPNTIASGRVCPGVLDASSSRWLISPDAWRNELRFLIDTTGGFRVVFANCNGDRTSAKSRFEILPGSYVDDPLASYADMLAGEALRPQQRTEAVRPADLSYSAKNVTHAAGAWVVQGQAESKYSYLMVTKSRTLDTATRVIVSGRIARGSLTIGLQTRDQWAVQKNVDAPGDFMAVLSPAARGSYSLVIANNLDKQLETSIMINRVEISMPGPAR